LPARHSLTITGVEHDDHSIRNTYEIRPPLSSLAGRPRVEARDDRGQEYPGLGQHLGLAGPESPTTMIGGFTMPPPQQRAALLRVRMSWTDGAASLWERPAPELRITL
jgi:hypothetical protein